MLARIPALFRQTIAANISGLLTLALAWGLSLTAGQAQSPADQTFLNYVRQTALELRRHDTPPGDLTTWQAQRALLRQQLELAWGGFPKEHAPLEPRILESLERPAYRIEKIEIGRAHV